MLLATWEVATITESYSNLQLDLMPAQDNNHSTTNIQPTLVNASIVEESQC